VHFTGPIYAEAEHGPLLRLPTYVSVRGPVGLMAMHAMIYGRPVITHDDFDQQKPEFEAIQAGSPAPSFDAAIPSTWP
jgi:hypothetical protein